MRAFWHACAAIVLSALLLWGAAALLNPSTGEFHAAESVNL